jgi:hypothetical protein
MSKRKYAFITKEFLEQEYLVKGKSLWQIAQELGFPNGARIQKIAKRYGILIRSSKEKALLKHKDKIPSKETLIELYFTKQLGFFEIIEILNIPRQTLEYVFDKYNLKRRTKEESLAISNARPKANRIDIPKDELLDLYVIQNKSLNDCANVFNTCGHTIKHRLMNLGVKIRPMKGKTHALYGKPVSDERRKKISITLGGTGELVDKARYVGFTDELRESIRKRDNYCCNECGFTNEEHLVAYKLSLSVHHIDYDKENSVEDNLDRKSTRLNSSHNVD